MASRKWKLPSDLKVNVMTSSRLSGPAFGTATLADCEREQIHLAGSIQPHGALLVLREPEMVVIQASANASNFLSIAGNVVGRTLDSLGGNLGARLQRHLTDPLNDMPVALRARVGSNRHALFDVSVHRPPCGRLVLELESAGPPLAMAETVERALREVLQAATLESLCDNAAGIFRQIAGFDRVMVYRFDEEGHGQVLSEARREDLEPLIGNRYPSTDIPMIARKLYERNRVRVLADVGFTRVPLEPPADMVEGGDLDMSLCMLRASSPIHVQYLKNMGVSATLVVSLMLENRLWGLIACHHYSPRQVQYEIRVVCDLLAEAVSTRIAALESFVQSQVELSVRRLEQRIIESITRDGDWRVALFDGSMSLLAPLDATGAALLFEGQCQTVGEVPGTEELRAIGRWLDNHAFARQSQTSVFSTAALGIDAPDFADIAGVASGLVATPVSTLSPGDTGEYIMWFRAEQVRTVTWGGNPVEAVVIGNNPADLSPRRSFAQWHQVVEGTSKAWSAADLAAARLIGESLMDVVLQFRSVRMLIAEEHLKQVSRQIRQSDQAVVIVGRSGRLLQVNPAFTQLLPHDHPPLRSIEDLPTLFSQPGEIRTRLADLRRAGRIWRGEVELHSARGTLPMLVRADPVFFTKDRKLGFVLLFTDLTERKAAEAARKRLHDGIMSGSRAVAGRMERQNNLTYQSMLTAVIENAHMAALEIADGVDTMSIPTKLDAVQASVSRTAEMLDRLIRHAEMPPGDETNA